MKRYRILSAILCTILVFSIISAEATAEPVEESEAEIMAEDLIDMEAEIMPEDLIDTEAEEVEQDDPLEEVNRAITEALKQTTPDMDSAVMQEFLRVGDIYDELVKEGVEIPQETASGIDTVRGRIYEVIRSDQGVTASSTSALERIWFLKTNVQEASNTEEIREQARVQFPGCSPVILYHKTIYYSDIRTGNTSKYPAMVSVTFPVPADYDNTVYPKVLSYTNSQLKDLYPVRNEDGSFYVSSARTLSNLCILDLPIALTGITIDNTAKVNMGQSITLKVKAVPEEATESYSLDWTSSNTKVATVNGSGVVKGIKEGTAVITAAVKENSNLKASCEITVVRGSHALKRSVSEVLNETKAYMLALDKSPTVGSEWFVIGLARGGLSLEDPYFATYYNHMANYIAEKDGKLTDSIKYTEYSKTIVSLTAIGKDAANVGGYNLLKPLADFKKVIAQGINGPIWALIAVNTNPDYSIPEDRSVEIQTTKESLIDYIVKAEKSGGGWNLMGNTGDSDLTGMALQALAPYYQKTGYEDVTAAVDRALAWLSGKQNASGGYSSMGAETSESCAQVIVGLCALGIDPETDERFVKGGSWTVENLLSYHIQGSGFMHVKAGSENNGGAAAGIVNGMATEQGYYALVAYQRMTAGKTGLYDMSDLKVIPGGKGDGKGTGIEATPLAGQPAATETPTPTPTPEADSDEGGESSTPAGSQKTVSPTGSSKQLTSADSTAKKKAAKTKKKDGWDFEADAYTEKADMGKADTEKADRLEAGNGDMAVKGQIKNNTVFVVIAAICLAAAGIGSGIVLYRSKKGGGRL